MSNPNAVEEAKAYFRNYASVVMPLHEALVRECCAAEHIPDDIASILEDIGQDFIHFSDLINHALRGRGVRTGMDNVGGR